TLLQDAGYAVVRDAPFLAFSAGRGVGAWPGRILCRWSRSLGEVEHRRRTTEAAGDEGEGADADDQPDRPDEQRPRGQARPQPQGQAEADARAADAAEQRMPTSVARGDDVVLEERAVDRRD